MQLVQTGSVLPVKAKVIILTALLILLSSCGSELQIQEGLQEYNIDKLDTNIDDFSYAQMGIYREDSLWVLCSNDRENFSVISASESGLSSHRLDFSLQAEEMVAGYTAAADGDTALIIQADHEYEVCRIGPDGEVKFNVRLDLSGGSQHVNMLNPLTDQAGNTVLAWNLGGGVASGVTVLSPEGIALFTLTGNDRIDDLAMLDTTTPIVLVGGNLLCSIDMVEQTWVELIEIQGEYTRVYAGSSNSVYLDDNQCVYELMLEDEQLTKQFSWAAIGVHSSPYWVESAAEKGSFYMKNAEGLFLISPRAEDDETDNRQVISLVTTEGVLISKAVAEYNQTSDEYRIELAEYNETNIDRLITQISGGALPDIFFYGADDLLTEALPSELLGNKGYLTDLLGCLDNDPQLGRSSFLENILVAAMQGDELYELPFAFWIDAIVGERSMVGTDSGWTFAEMADNINTISFDGYLLGPNWPRNVFLDLMLTFNSDSFIDWGQGVCTFDSEEFYQTLEIAKMYAPADMEPGDKTELERIAEGEQLLVYTTIGAPNELQILDYYFDEPVFVGFPTSDGNGNAIRYYGSFAISSATEYVDEAWAFIRNFYSTDYYEANAHNIPFPTTTEALEQKLIQDDGGFILSFGDENGEELFSIEATGATERDVTRTRQLIASLDRVSRRNVRIMDIIFDEASSYFEQDKSAEDVCRVIQRRVQTYLSEQ